ncbi:cysteine desulfurase family protein [Pseudoglutamicibacter cumminsii]|uniref:Cysteine desulfurase family protein n=1 Tax=Pseudoglutamicibacter cumminsii TaxID=156979 RepID=A0AAP4C633_9MICC|nr:cysteine desulfurase family protein [Pseudoglutamicibacter cumminsii]MDK6274520.1 cysteine desulfurase family protein [Pseudoglutamicibacter cumminsii]
MRNQPAHYFDHAATTPLSEPARAALIEHMGVVGNAGSLHTAGRTARRIHDAARIDVARAAGVDPAEIIFTSGGTEADNLAIKGLYAHRNAGDQARPRIIYTGIEHPAVLDVIEYLAQHHAAEPVLVPVGHDAVVDIDAWRAALAEAPERTALATLMWANNEVGTIQPIEEAAAAAAEHGIPFHTDAVQAFGHIPAQLDNPAITTAAITAHKLGGPVGIGALIVRRAAQLAPHIHGGGQERGMRSGTADVASAAAFAAAAQAAQDELATECERLSQLRDQLVTAITETIPNATVSGSNDPAQQLPSIVHLSVPGAQGDSVLFLLDSLGFATSTGSACTAGMAQPSHVLLAMGRSKQDATDVQRFSMGPLTTPEAVQALIDALPGVIEQARVAGGA